jgi:hypothetical protein
MRTLLFLLLLAAACESARRQLVSGDMMYGPGICRVTMDCTNPGTCGVDFFCDAVEPHVGRLNSIFSPWDHCCASLTAARRQDLEMV